MRCQWFWSNFTCLYIEAQGCVPVLLENLHGMSCLVWWALLLFLYLLGIPLSLHFGYIAAFGVAFLYSGSLWSSLYYGVSSLSVGLYQWLVKVSLLGKLVSEF